jgi:hypothetical protein
MDKRIILETWNGLKFYEDGTYLRTGGETSWWMRDEKGISVRHHEDRDWMPIYVRSVSDSDLRVNRELIEVLDILMEKEFEIVVLDKGQE